MRSIKRHFELILCLCFLVITLFFACRAFRSGSSDIRNIVINEVCLYNLSCLYDENGKHSDWAELYNKGDRDLDISGWYLSDSSSKRDKWAFPAGTVVPGGGYLTVFMDSREEKEPDQDESFSLESFILNGKAIPAGDNGLHTTFRLSKNETLYLSSKDGNPVDSFELIPLKYDTTLSRLPDGSASVSRRTPTPLSSNSESAPVIYPSLSEPVFSRESGFYDSEFELSLSSFEGDIYYTLDGSEPTPSSIKYDKPIRICDRSSENNVYSALRDVSVDLLPYIDYKFSLPFSPVPKCNVVRAAVFDEKGNRSETVSRSFFPSSVNSLFKGIRVISLVTDPVNLFDYEKGIYVIGKNGVESFERRLSESENALSFIRENPGTPTDGSVIIGDVKMDEFIESNYTMRGSAWERESFLTLFDDRHVLSLSESLGIRVKGHRTCNFPKKSLNLYGRNYYGGKIIDKGIFDKDYSRLTLFAGGQDELSLVRDAFISDITSKLSFASLSFTSPCALFLDGEFWGIYRISEKMDEDFIGRHYDVDPDQVVMVKNSLLSKGIPEDDELYGDLRHFIMNADFTAGTDYERFQEMVDIESLLDFYAARIFIDEGMDWPNINVAFWRTRETDDSNPFADGRWRYINFDNNSNLDYGAVSVNTIGKALNGTKNYRPDELFSKLMKNPDFKKRFLKRFKEIIASAFDPESAIKKLDRYAAEIRPYIESDYSRYYGDRYTLKDFDEDIESIRKYLQKRPDYIIPFVEEACSP